MSRHSNTERQRIADCSSFPCVYIACFNKVKLDGGKAFAKILETDTSLAWKLVFLVKSNFAPTSELTADHLDKRPGMHIILHPNMLFFLTKTSRFSRLQFNGLDDETKAAVTYAWGKRDGDKRFLKTKFSFFKI